MTGQTNSYGLYVNSQTGASNNYAATFLGGSVGIGTATPLDTLSIGTAPVASATRSVLNLTNTTVNAGNVNGTFVSANISGFTGDFINFSNNTLPLFRVDSEGDVTGGNYIGNYIEGQSINGTVYLASQASSTDPYVATHAARKFPGTGGNVYVGNESWVDSTASKLRMYATNGSGNAQNSYIATISTTGAGVYTPEVAFGLQTGANAYAEKMRLTGTGLGIGTTSPTASLDVSGSIAATGNVTNAGITRNLNSQADNGDLTIAFTRNVMKTDQSCGATTLSGLADGGSYSLLYNGTAGGTCSFTHAGLTVVMPQGHVAIPASQRALYTFVVVGTELFVSYVTF